MRKVGQYIRAWGLTGAALALSVFALYRAAEADRGIPAPGSLSYEGSLQLDGLPYDGTADVTLRLFDTPAMDAMLCESMATVTVSEGRFSVELPEACTQAVEANTEAWLVVSVSAGGETQSFPPERLHAVPYAVSARRADNGVPLGAVVPWWRPTNETPVPDGWEVCDGSEVADPSSPLFGSGVRKPDLRGRFLLGAGGAGPVPVGEGALGGARQVMTSTDGSHNHQWLGVIEDGRFYTARADGSDVLMIRWGDGFDGGGSGTFAPALDAEPGRSGPPNAQLYTKRAGEHSHTVELLPPYAGLLYLCRVR